MTDISEGILFRRGGVDPSQWPKLSCSAANELALEIGHLILEGDRSLSFKGNGELSFHGNGQLKATGDLRCFTGNPATEKLTVLANGNVGIDTMNPNHKLAIASGDINIDDGRALRQAGRWMIGGDANILGIGSANDDDGRDIRFDPGFSGALTIKKDTGNIGIRTNEPAARLHIHSTDNDAFKITNPTHSKTCRMGVDQLGVWIEPSETNSSIRLNANPNLVGLYIKGTDGNVGIGTSDPKARLDVIGDVQATGSVSAQNGQVRRDFIAWSTTERRSDPIHIKTNIPKKSNVMYRVLVEGYNYGMGAVINSDIVGYTYTGWETIGQAQANNYTGGVAISQYYSSDGYVVIKLTTQDTYYLGFAASAWFTNPNGNGFNIAVQAILHQAADL